MLTNLGPARLTTDHAASSCHQPVLVLADTGHALGVADIHQLLLIRATAQELLELERAGYHIRLGYHLQRRGAAGYP